MPNNLRNKVNILVFQEGVNGPIRSFNSIEETSDYFNVNRDTIIRKLMNGEKLNGCFFDWGLDTSSEIIEELENRYRKRFANNKRYSLEYYYNATQKEM